MPGSWTKRGKDAYRLQICIGTDFKGKPNVFNKTVHCKSDKEADKELAKFYTTCEAGDFSNVKKITLSNFCNKWLEDYSKNKIRASSYVKYSSIINNWISPTLGNKNIVNLKPLDIIEWLKYLNDYQKVLKDGSIKKLSMKSIHDNFSLLNQILLTSKKWGIIKNNPCDNIDRPTKGKPEVDFYNLDEVKLLLSKLSKLNEKKDHVYKVAIYLDLLSGLRGGELAGLKWVDIDLDKSELSIRQIRQYVHKVGVIESNPKTENSVRTISIPQICINLLRELKKQQLEQRISLGNKWENSGYVFITEFGKPFFPRKISKWFSEFLERESLRRITLHKLRHTHVSMLDYLNVNETEISARVGHSNLSTTRNTYTHIFNKADKEVSSKIDLFFKDEIV